MSHSCAFELDLFSIVKELCHFLYLALEFLFKNTNRQIVNLKQEQEPSVHTYESILAGDMLRMEYGTNANSCLGYIF